MGLKWKVGASSESLDFLILALKLRPRPGLLIPPPAFGERRHCGLATLSIAVCWRAILVLPKSQGPHPRRPYRGGMYLQDAADDSAIGKHVEIIIVPVAGWARSGGTLKH